MILPETVRLVEVGPRDGLQNQSCLLSTEHKIEFINRLSKTGLTTIEATAFVSPRWIPQMEDHAAVLTGIDKVPGVTYPVLVPNVQGLEAALAAGVKDIAVFVAASETFSRKNTNCSIAESLERVSAVIEMAKIHFLRVRGYLSCVAGCPYEGKIAEAAVINLTETLLQYGCHEVSLGDTIGVGTPRQIEQLLNAVCRQVSLSQVAVHFHDTWGQALANILVALQCGVRVIDSAVAGLGGCPYAKGATGNVASEDVLYLLNGLGIETGVNLRALAEVGQWVCELLEQPVMSKVNKALLHP